MDRPQTPHRNAYQTIGTVASVASALAQLSALVVIMAWLLGFGSLAILPVLLATVFISAAVEAACLGPTTETQ